MKAEKLGIILERCPAGLFLSFDRNGLLAMRENRNLGGVLLETGHAAVTPPLCARVRILDLPTVIPHGVASDAEVSGFLVQRTDERTAFADAYRYLAAYGHRRIAGLFIRLADEGRGTARGFTPELLREFLDLNGLDTRPELSVFSGNDPEFMRRTVRSWILSAAPPTAILCHSDRIAMRVYAALKELDVRIPAQISVMGYSNYPGSQLLQPALTTIDIHFRTCGRRALHRLLAAQEWFRRGVTPPEEFTDYEIVERGSVGTV